jgi:hypothetical protein
MRIFDEESERHREIERKREKERERERKREKERERKKERKFTYAMLQKKTQKVHTNIQCIG